MSLEEKKIFSKQTCYVFLKKAGKERAVYFCFITYHSINTTYIFAYSCGTVRPGSPVLLIQHFGSDDDKQKMLQEISSECFKVDSCHAG